MLNIKRYISKQVHRFILNPINKIKILLRIIREYDSDIDRINKKAQQAENTALKARRIIQERTDLNADMSFHRHSYSHVILMGRYKNRDYVEIFSVTPETLNELIPMLREMQKHARLRRADGPIGMKQIIDRELLK